MIALLLRLQNNKLRNGLTESYFGIVVAFANLAVLDDCKDFHADAYDFFQVDAAQDIQEAAVPVWATIATLHNRYDAFPDGHNPVHREAAEKSEEIHNPKAHVRALQLRL
jgi:hypothetical protein